MDVKLPDGRVLRGIPDGTTKAQLAQKLAANGIKIPGVSAPSAADEAAMGGTGGYDPMESMLGGTVSTIGGKLGLTPENTANPIANAFGPAEAAAKFGTGAIATPVAGLAGLAQGTKNLVSPGMPAADRVRQVQNAMTYQPRTGSGAGLANVAAAPMDAYSAGTNYLGEKATDVTGSPAIGAAIKTAGDIAPALLARGERPAQQPKGTYAPPTKFGVPTTEELTSAAKDAYKAGKESGVIVPAEGYADALGKVQQMVKAEGLNPKLHPKSTAVMEVLNEASGKPLTLQEAETLRKIALDAEDDMNPVTRGPTPDARIAGKIVDELDNSIEALSTNSPARALWARSRRSQMLDQMIHRAEIKAGANYTQAGMEHALRLEFKQLALNPRRMRGLTAEQRAAIEKVATGGPMENTLRALGKFDPTSSVVSAAGSLGTGALLSPMTGGISALLPAAGFISKRLATRATARNVDLAREALVGRGAPSAAAQSRGLPRQPSAAPSAALSSTVPRSSASIRGDIQKLIQTTASKALKDGPGSASAQAIWLELARLQAELKSAEAREAAPDVPAGPQGR